MKVIAILGSRNPDGQTARANPLENTDTANEILRNKFLPDTIFTPNYIRHFA